jgi:hypothetical protein
MAERIVDGGGEMKPVAEDGDDLAIAALRTPSIVSPTFTGSANAILAGPKMAPQPRSKAPATAQSLRECISMVAVLRGPPDRIA